GAPGRWRRVLPASPGARRGPPPPSPPRPPAPAGPYPFLYGAPAAGRRHAPPGCGGRRRIAGGRLDGGPAAGPARGRRVLPGGPPRALVRRGRRLGPEGRRAVDARPGPVPDGPRARSGAGAARGGRRRRPP